MAKLRRVGSPALTSLDEVALEGLGCPEHGIVVLEGATSWGAHERGWIELPLKAGPATVPIAYDEREAPFAADEDGEEQRDLLLSLTDEGERIACAWARPEEGSALVGVGIDLCSTERFHESEGRRDLGRLLLTERERELVPRIAPDDPALAKATLFAAKEASFKALAAPLRTWYRHHDDKLLFGVRHFVMEEPGLERGTWRNGAAQDAMDRMGIRELRVCYGALDDMAVVVATALAG